MTHAIALPLTRSAWARHGATALTGTLAGALALAAVSSSMPQMARAATPAGQENGALVMAIGESRVINLPANMSDVVIANPAVLDVHVRSSRQVYLMAKAPGETNVFITAADGKML